jgi:hypothetical protein
VDPLVDHCLLRLTSGFCRHLARRATQLLEPGCCIARSCPAMSSMSSIYLYDTFAHSGLIAESGLRIGDCRMPGSVRPVRSLAEGDALLADALDGYSLFGDVHVSDRSSVPGLERARQSDG